MYKQNNNILADMLLLLVDFINCKNCDLNLNISINDKKYIVCKFDSRIFFKTGELLMLFYILNINSTNRDYIKHKDNSLYIPLSSINSDYINKTTSENIINNLIEKSTYNKEILPMELININDKNLMEIENGFELTYKTFINEKINLINFLNEYDINHNCYNLIRDIKLLSPHDLNIQLKFIRLKFKKEILKDKAIENLINCKENHDDFIELSKEALDLLIKNGIIALQDNKMELMWIGYVDEKLQPINYRNIYIAILFSYAWKTTSQKYYLEVVKHSVNPLLAHMNTFSENYKDLLITFIKEKNSLNPNLNDSYDGILINEYYDVLKLLYLLNNYIEFKDLNEFIAKNRELFNLISFDNKLECNSNTESLILESIYNKSLNLLNTLIIE